VRAMIAQVLEIKGGDEVSNTSDVINPTVFNDGTVELCVDLVGKDRNVYVRFSVSDLIAIVATAERESAA